VILELNLRQQQQTCDFSAALNDPHGDGLPPEGVQQSPRVERALVLQPWKTERSGLLVCVCVCERVRECVCVRE